MDTNWLNISIMEEKILNRIRLVENKIERCLSEEDFISIPALTRTRKTDQRICISLETADNLKSNSEELEKISSKLRFSKPKRQLFSKITDLRYLLKLKCTELTRNIVDKYLLS